MKSQQSHYDQDLVSIIMPAYNAELFFEETLNSIINQSYHHWELIVVDDQSTDNTANLIEGLVKKDKRIHLIKSKTNNGPAVSRNIALDAAKGRWIAFLDSDDIWLENKLEQTIKFSRQKNAPFVFTSYRRFMHGSNVVGRIVKAPDIRNYNQLLSNNIIATSTVLIDRNKIPHIEMKDYYYDDFVCWLSILKSGIDAYGLDIDLMRYRVISGSVSRNKFKSALKVWDIFRRSENMPLMKASFYMLKYAFIGIIKYSRF